MVFSVVLKQPMSLRVPHQDPGNCPAPPRHFLGWGGGKRYWQLQHKKKILSEARESENGPNSWRTNMHSLCHRLLCLCIACPRKEATGRWHRLIKSSWTPSPHLWSKSPHCGAEGTGADVSHQSSTGAAAPLQIHTQ